MERNDDTGARATGGDADDRIGRDDSDRDARSARTSDAHDGPARAEQTDEGYETGYDQERDTAEEQLEPNFARGIADEDAPDTQHKGRFSEGQEDLPETPEKNVERRFSEGIERDPESE